MSFDRASGVEWPAGSVRPVGPQRPSHSPKTDRAGRFLKGLIIVLLVFLAGEIVFHLLIAPELSVTEIAVTSDGGGDRGEIIAAAGLTGAPLYFQVDTAEAAAGIEALPWVKSAEVQKVFPNAVDITVVERRPVAMALSESSVGSMPILVDEEGILYAAGNHLATDELPLVSGLRLSDYRPGARVDRRLTAFFEDLSKLKLESPTLYRLISEYRVIPRGEHDFEIVMYPVVPRVPVRVGNSVTAELIRTVVLVLDVVKDQAPRELDFRSGNVVFRPGGD